MVQRSRCSIRSSFQPIGRRRGWMAERIAEYNRSRFEDLITAGWDLVGVDEAHRPSGSTDQVARYKLDKGLAEAAPCVLFLSAPPTSVAEFAFDPSVVPLNTLAEQRIIES